MTANPAYEFNREQSRKKKIIKDTVSLIKTQQEIAEQTAKNLIKRLKYQ